MSQEDIEQKIKNKEKLLDEIQESIDLNDKINKENIVKIENKKKEIINLDSIIFEKKVLLRDLQDEIKKEKEKTNIKLAIDRIFYILLINLLINIIIILI